MHMPKVVLCYARQVIEVPEGEELPRCGDEEEGSEDEELRDLGPTSYYYLAGLLVDRTFYGNPNLLHGKLPPLQSSDRLLDLVSRWAPHHRAALDAAPQRVGHFTVHHWLRLEGEDQVRYLEVDANVDQADMVGSWMLPEEPAEEDPSEN